MPEKPRSFFTPPAPAEEEVEDFSFAIPVEEPGDEWTEGFLSSLRGKLESLQLLKRTDYEKRVERAIRRAFPKVTDVEVGQLARGFYAFEYFARHDSTTLSKVLDVSELLEDVSRDITPRQVFRILDSLVRE